MYKTITMMMKMKIRMIKCIYDGIDDDADSNVGDHET